MLLFCMPKKTPIVFWKSTTVCTYTDCAESPFWTADTCLTSKDSHISNSTGAVYDTKGWDLEKIAVTNVNLPNQTLGRSKEELRHQCHTADLKQASQKAPRSPIWSFHFCSLALDYNLKKIIASFQLILQYCMQFCTLKENDGNFCDF